MMKKNNFLLVLAMLGLTSFNAMAAVECAPQVNTLLSSNASYKKLNGILKPKVNNLTTLLNGVKDQASYVKLLAASKALIGGVANGRMVITLADGTVVVDTGKVDDPNNAEKAGNSFKHFKDKSVNENHNSRVAIMLAQTHECGVGVETKFSSSDGSNEKYVAIRLGKYLDSAGTARLSTK
jgi:predicted house-cleaning NTP pyrophosphatase (Maf/HAM1 superfamily)